MILLPVEIRTLSGTDLQVSRICLGAMTFGQQADQCTANEIVKCCFEAGINFFDTANIYSRGKSEEIPGKALKGHRTKVVLASKVGTPRGEGTGEGGLSRAAVLHAIDQSLRLQTDYLDIYYLQQPDYSVSIEQTLEVRDELVRSGRVRYAATSNYAIWQVCQMLGIAERNGYPCATIAQLMYNLLARGIVILGASRFEQLRGNLSVMNEGPLCRPALAACDQLWTELKGVTPKYNR